MSARYGLLGEKLGHSFSPQIHRELGGYEYALMEVAREDLSAFFAARDFEAINVTIPYKQAVLPWMDSLSVDGQPFGSCPENWLCKYRRKGCFRCAARLQHRLLRFYTDGAPVMRCRCRAQMPGAGQRRRLQNGLHRPPGSGSGGDCRDLPPRAGQL